MSKSTRVRSKPKRRRKKHAPASGHSGPSYAEIRACIEIESQCQRVYGNSRANVAPHLAKFREHVKRYKQRFEREGKALSFIEAVDLFRLYPRIDPASSIPLSDTRLVASCITDGKFNGQRVRDLFEAWITPEEEQDEKQLDETPAWNRYRAQAALDVIASMDSSELSIVGTTPDGSEHELTFAEAMPHFPRVSRPRGRYDVRANTLRDVAICNLLRSLEGCGLTVTSKNGPSLAGALAEAWNYSLAAIERAWKSGENLDRTDKKRRTRRCARCGNPAGEGAHHDHYGDRVCAACQERN